MNTSSNFQPEEIEREGSSSFNMSPKDNQDALDQPSGSEEPQDFFNQIQKKEKDQGISARGKGHGWATLAEILMGDW